MKLALAFLAACGLAAYAQACCFTGDAYLKYLDDLHFDQTPPLTADEKDAFYRCLGGRDPTLMYTSPGSLNIAGCNADHCYGDSDCAGTNDTPQSDQSLRYQVIKQAECNLCSTVKFNCPALLNFRVKGYTGLCRAPSGRRLAQTQAARDCADLEQLINEPLTQTAARLSTVLCEPGSEGVGLTFAGAVLASWDADKNGNVTCIEYGIAKMRTTIQQLDGTYRGPAKLPAPLCKLSKSGAAYLARYNEYLGELTLGTLKVNATGYALTTAQRAAAKVEAAVVGNAGVGKLLDVTDKVAAKFNVTLPPPGL